jgi:AcrR family transcriptional regulator
MSDIKNKSKKAKLTEERLLSAAKKVFQEKGFHRSSVRDISKEASLGHGTFYLYFKDKKDVFYALIKQVENELFTVSVGSGLDLDQDYERGRNSYRALRQDLKAVFRSFMENASVIKFSKELALTDKSFSIKYRELRERLIKRTEQILLKSKLKNLDLHIAAIAITGMIEAVAEASLDQGDSDLDMEALVPTVTKLYFKAVS